MQRLSPIFHFEPSGEQGMNERQEVEQNERVKCSEERMTDCESRTESDTQLDGGQERWRDDGDGSLADDEDEDDDEGHRMSFAFTPQVTVLRKTTAKQTECCDVRDEYSRADDAGGDEVQAGDVRDNDVSRHWENTNPQELNSSCCMCCGEMMSSVLFLLLGVAMFPLLMWGGHELLPIDLPVVQSAPYRLVYTLRCAFFAIFPIIFGVLVHGLSCLKFSSLNPLFEGKRASRHTVVHMTYVQDSLRLFLLFFVQLAVMSTYIHHDALKLVPLLTIIFVFGRLIYWPGVCFSSGVWVLGFSLSFLPIVALVGFNLYFICSATGEGVVFDVAPPTTPPPPKVRWWG